MVKIQAIFSACILAVCAASGAQAQYGTGNSSLPLSAFQADPPGTSSSANFTNPYSARHTARPVQTGPLLRDPAGYQQFMKSVQSNINVEYANNAEIEAARTRDARMTQAYFKRRIADSAAMDRYASGRSTSHYHGTRDANGLYPDIASQSSLDSSYNEATRRGQAIQDAGNNLRDQVLQTQANPQKFGIQSIGTNLYVRQYGLPDAKLPPVHNAAARIVPYGAGDD